MTIFINDPMQGTSINQPSPNRKFYKTIGSLTSKASIPANRVTRGIARKLKTENDPDKRTYITVKDVPGIIERLNIRS